MNEAEITQYILDTFEGVHAVDAWGYTFFYYNPHREVADEFYFATLMRADDEYDNVSQVNREGVFRLNMGVGKETFRNLFGAPPSRQGGEEGATVEVERDFAALDQLLPHPLYGRQYWVCVLNPADDTFERVRLLLAEAYALAVGKFERRARVGELLGLLG